MQMEKESIVGLGNFDKKDESRVLREISDLDPRDAYSKVKEKMMELEIERDENLKTLEYLK